MRIGLGFNYKINFKLIFDYIKENKLDISEFCNLCNITLSDFGDLLKESQYINPSVFYKIIEALKIDYENYFLH